MNQSDMATLVTGDELERTNPNGTKTRGIIEERGDRDIHVGWDDGVTGILAATKNYPNIRKVDR